MSTVEEYLQAARALIDTPEKLAITSVSEALDAVAVGSRHRRALGEALGAVSGDTDFRSHSSVMAMFDRAISSARSQ